MEALSSDSDEDLGVVPASSWPLLSPASLPLAGLRGPSWPSLTQSLQHSRGPSSPGGRASQVAQCELSPWFLSRAFCSWVETAGPVPLSCMLPPTTLARGPGRLHPEPWHPTFTPPVSRAQLQDSAPGGSEQAGTRKEQEGEWREEARHSSAWHCSCPRRGAPRTLNQLPTHCGQLRVFSTPWRRAGATVDQREMQHAPEGTGR